MNLPMTSTRHNHAPVSGHVKNRFSYAEKREPVGGAIREPGAGCQSLPFPGRVQVQMLLSGISATRGKFLSDTEQR